MQELHWMNKEYGLLEHVLHIQQTEGKRGRWNMVNMLRTTLRMNLLNILRTTSRER